MPHRLFAPRCVHAPDATLTDRVQCEICGAAHQFAGWFRDRYECMAVYQYAYGLKPLGPHRELADQLMGPKRIRCRRCAGRGILTIDRDHWYLCPMCEGTGGFWDCGEEELDVVRERILERFPDAALIGAPASLVSPGLALSHREGAIVDLLAEEPPFDPPTPDDPEEPRSSDPEPTDLMVGIPSPLADSESLPESSPQGDRVRAAVILLALVVLAIVAAGYHFHETLRVIGPASAGVVSLYDTYRPDPRMKDAESHG